MRSPFLAILVLALATPPALAGEEPASDPANQGVGKDFAEEVTAVEVRAPARGSYFPTRRGHAIGDFTAVFFAGERVTFEDNIFRTDRDTESDTVFSTTLGARLTTEGARMDGDLAAALTHDDYVHNDGEDFLGGWLDLRSRFGMERGPFLEVTDRLDVREDSVTTSLSAPGNPVLAASGTRVRQVQNDLGLTGGLRGEKSEAEVRYDHFRIDYGSPLDPLSSIERRATFVGRRSASPKSEANLQVEARAVRYDDPANNDYDALGSYVGGRWDATPKTSLQGRIGLLVQDVSAGGVNPDSSEFSGTAGTLSILHEVGPELFVDGTISRDIYPALGSNYQLIELAGAGARWEFRPDWIARAGASLQRTRNSDGIDGSFYTMQAEISWSPSDRWAVSLVGEHQQFQGNVVGSDYAYNRVGLQVSVNF